MGPRQRQGRSRSKTHALPIILLSFLGFLLIAGVAFGIGMVGNVNRWLSDLPDYTDANAYLVSEPTEIVDCNGNKIASFYTQNRKSITKDEVSPYVLQGTVDVEDERFYEHGGIDLWGIARAAVATLGGGHEGASTITQQLVRNTILQEEQFDSTIERKVREAYIAVKMEDMYSKDEILMMYLNTIYYGHGAYGIEAAAETYLSKSAADLTLSEAALLQQAETDLNRMAPATWFELQRNLSGLLARTVLSGNKTAEVEALRLLTETAMPSTQVGSNWSRLSWRIFRWNTCNEQHVGSGFVDLFNGCGSAWDSLNKYDCLHIRIRCHLDDLRNRCLSLG